MTTTERIRRLDPVGLAQLRAASDHLDTQLRVYGAQHGTCRHGALAQSILDEARTEARTLAARMAARWGWGTK